MKNWFKKIKGITQGTDFFWEMIVVSFFVILVAILISCVIFRFQTEQSLSASPPAGEISKASTLSTEALNKVLDNIKKRSEEFSHSLVNSSSVTDPSR